MNLVEVYAKQKANYLRRYKEYLWKYLLNPNDMDSHGHAMECSWVLIEIFGVSSKELEQLDREFEREMEDKYGNEK